jgi:hypothetical protein
MAPSAESVMIFKNTGSRALDLTISTTWNQVAVPCQAKPMVNTLIITL